MRHALAGLFLVTSLSACAFDDPATDEEADLEEIEAPADLAGLGVVSCVRQPKLAQPPAPSLKGAPVAAPSLAAARRPCPAGFVPSLAARHGAKMRPQSAALGGEPSDDDDARLAAAWGVDYHYAVGYQWT